MNNLMILLQLRTNISQYTDEINITKAGVCFPLVDTWLMGSDKGYVLIFNIFQRIVDLVYKVNLFPMQTFKFCYGSSFLGIKCIIVSYFDSMSRFATTVCSEFNNFNN